MINILLAGVGGQGTVLAAKVLASAASARGWQVRTAETIGMAQRGGSVVSHVRMAPAGEEVFSSLVMPGTADIIIALEPGEAARALPYLAPGAVLVTATTAIQPVTAALASTPYRAEDVVASLASALEAVDGHPAPLFVPVDDAALVAELGPASRKSLNMMLLAVAVAQNRIPLTLDEVKQAVETCVKPQFVAMNLEAIDHAVAAYAS